MGQCGGTLGSSSTAEDVIKFVNEEAKQDLTGQVFIVTGANSGIGYSAAHALAGSKATVILACRVEETGKETEVKIREETSNENVEFLHLDLASFDSIKKFVNEFLKKDIPLHCLINNAGVVMLGEHTPTKDGFETQFGVNHLGHFLLTDLLLSKLKSSGPSRVVNVSSAIHTRGGFDIADMPPKPENYGAMKNYAISKMCNVLFTLRLNELTKDDGITAYSVHPGTVQTRAGRHIEKDHPILVTLMKPFSALMKTSPQGAATVLYCALVPDIVNHSGQYFADCALADHSTKADDEKLQNDLWKLSEELCGIKKDAPINIVSDGEEEAKVEAKKEEEEREERGLSEDENLEENGENEEDAEVPAVAGGVGGEGDGLDAEKQSGDVDIAGGDAAVVG